VYYLLFPFFSHNDPDYLYRVTKTFTDVIGFKPEKEKRGGK
jgi:hypothetical protein